MSSLTSPAIWKRDHFIKNPFLRWTVIILLTAYVLYALNDMDLNWARMKSGWPRAVDFFHRMFPPDFSRWSMIQRGVLESLQMAIISTTISIILAVPLSLGAARNISVRWVYLLSRAFVVVARSFPPILVAIIFVKAFGFGPFPGILTLAFTALGFMGKLLGEVIENIDPGQVEAIRATGANWFKVQLYGVAPQVLPRYVGLSIYLLDINLRASTIIGIVGAGGIGGALFNAFHRYEYDTALAILVVIIAIVLVMEFISSKVRGRLQ